MPNVFSLIGSAWKFYRKQPALTPVLFWFLFLPLLGVNVLTRMITPPKEGLMLPGSYEGMVEPTPSALLIFIPAVIVLSLVAVWGTACVLLVGKRLIQSKAGRSRTSFNAVRKDAMSYVFPVFLTGVLRGCFTIFWMLAFVAPVALIVGTWLFITMGPDAVSLYLATPQNAGMAIGLAALCFFVLSIPAFIYSIRTAFYEVVVVAEDISYRSALRKSKQVVRGHSWRVFFYLMALSLFLFAPATIIVNIVDIIIRSIDARLLILSDIVMAAAMSFSTLLYLLTNVELFGKLKKARPQHVEG